MTQVVSEATPAPATTWLSNVSSVARQNLVFAVGAVAAGLGALYFNYAEDYGGRFFHAVWRLSPWLAAALAAGGMVLICRLRDLYFPGTEGTGIPQSIAALKLDASERRAALSPRIAVGKILLLTLALFTGLTVGREGPSVHVAACFLFFAASYARFPEHVVQRGLILSGGAAGIAAAFNAPIAGIIFTFEEIGRSFDKRNLGWIVRAVIIACLVCVLFLQDYLFYGHVEGFVPNLWRPWLGVVVIGLLGGLLGGLFAAAVVWCMPRVSRLMDEHPVIVPAVLGTILGLIGLASGGLSYGGGYIESSKILMEGAEYSDAFPLWRALASFAAILSAIPGGIFDPSLTVGAGLGSSLQGWFTSLEPQAVILLFMAAYFAAVVQSPVTATVILLEMTDARTMTLPLATASILAYEVSRRVCPTSLYESLAENFIHRMWLRYDQLR
ncbi:MAG: chloride channel protein [Pirellulales bacterium]|nr:chloride channel protein [Pirellulales bacterium]